MTTARSIWHLDGQAATRELVVTVPVKVLSEANLRNGHMARWRRGKKQKHDVGLVLNAALGLHGHPGFPCIVTLVRLIGSGGRRLDDDNAVSGFKAIRDCVAACLKVDDGSPLVTWRYEQRGDKPPAWGVEVRIAGRRTEG